MGQVAGSQVKKHRERRIVKSENKEIMKKTPKVKEMREPIVPKREHQ